MAKQSDSVAALRTASYFWALSPARFQEPLWIATGRHRHTATFSFNVEWLRWSPARMTTEVLEGQHQQYVLRITEPARTVADFFAHHRRLDPGEPTAVLKAFRASRFWNKTKLLEAADLCRVTKLVKSALRFS